MNSYLSLISEFLRLHSPDRSARYPSYLSRGTTRFAKLKTKWLGWNVTRLSDESWDTSECPLLLGTNPSIT